MTARHRLPRAAPSAARTRAALLLAALTTGAFGALAVSAGQPPPAPPASEAVSLVAADPLRPIGPHPVRLAIPAIGLDAELAAVHRDSNGALDPPADGRLAGWYADGVVPGGRGPAVVVGHVDSRSGPAVFFELDRLRPGDEITVDVSDGTTHRFVVDSAERFAKAEFPTEKVYGPTALPELRLITCTGSFDSAARSYTDNLVVRAYTA